MGFNISFVNHVKAIFVTHPIKKWILWIITTSYGVNIIGNARWGDNRKATFGNDGTDLQIYHDGSHSRIVDNGTGVLALQGSDVNIHNPDASENMILAAANGAVRLYYDNAKKAETVTGGFTITGTCTAKSFSGDGSNLTGITASADLVGDTSPQLGGDLDTNDHEIFLDDNRAIKFGA